MASGLPFRAGRFRAQTDRILTGVRSVVAVNNTGAAVDWTTVVPGGQSWRIICGYALLTANATGLTGTGFQINIDGQTVYKFADNSGLAASSATNISYINNGSGMTGFAVGAGDLITIPSIWLPEAATFGSFTSLVANVTSFTNIRLYIEKQYVTDGELNDIALALHSEELAVERYIQSNPQAGIEV